MRTSVTLAALINGGACLPQVRLFEMTFGRRFVFPATRAGYRRLALEYGSRFALGWLVLRRTQRRGAIYSRYYRRIALARELHEKRKIDTATYDRRRWLAAADALWDHNHRAS